MKVLLITSEVPYPPLSGGSLRVWGLVRGLHQAGHALTLLCLQKTPVAPELAAAAEIVLMTVPARTPWHRLVTLLTSLKPDIAERLYDPVIVERIIALCHTQLFDLIQFEGIESACYLPSLRAALPEARLIFDTFNAEAMMQASMARIDAQQPRRWIKALYSWIQSRRITSYERHLCRLADLVLAVSPEDAALLALYQPRRPVCVIPSGITVADYTRRTIPQDERLLVFTGKMDYRPNTDAVEWFVSAVLPLLARAQFSIVGQQPTLAVQALVSDQVEVTGRVSSVLPYLHRAAVYVAPLRMGSGTRLKILEALACECAIVATSLAASGLTKEVRAGLITADSADDFAAAVQRLLDDPPTRQHYQAQARQLVYEHYDWEALMPRLLSAYERLLNA